MKIYFLIFFLILLKASTAVCFNERDSNVVIINQDFKKENITKKIKYQEILGDKFLGFEFVDASKNVRTEKRLISLGYSNKGVYVSVNISNNSNEQKDLILLVSRAVIQNVKHEFTRNQIPFSQIQTKELKDLPGVPIKFSIESYEEIKAQLFIDCEGLSNTYPIYLYENETYLNEVFKMSIINSIHTGAMVLLILVLLFYGYLSKYKYFTSFGLYALAYVAANTLLSDSLNFLFEDQVYLNTLLLLFFVDATVVSLMSFIKTFFYPLHSYPPVFIKVFSSLQFISVLHFILALSGLIETYFIVLAINFLTLGAVLTVVVFLFSLNNRYLNYNKRNIVLLAFSVIFVDVLFYALYFIGLIESSLHVEMAHKLLLGAHFVTLAFVILNMYQDKQFHYRNLAIVRLQKLNEAIVENRKELEAKVKERTFGIFERNRIIDEQKRKIELKNVELTKAYNEAKENAKSKEDFLANMSHEIRTPLNGILGILDVFEDNNLNSKQKGQIEILKNSSESLYEIINDILTISKINAKKLEVHPVDFHPAIALKNSFNLFLSKAEIKGLDYNISISDEIPEVIHQDITKIKQIVNNLLSNAIKFTDYGSVTLRAYYQKNSKIRIEVEDTGKGVDKDLAPKLFDKFYQLKEDANSFTGTGLGLTICRDLVELMGGEIGVESKKNVGSVFYFELPFDKAKNTDSLKGADRVVAQKLLYKNILVVEDIVLNQQVMKSLLDQFDLTYAFAGNGVEAVEQVEKDRYDLIFMDIRMPIMNGIEATRILREELEYKGVIVGLSANEADTQKDFYKSIGFNSYMEKPIRLSQLKDLLFNDDFLLKEKGESKEAAALESAVVIKEDVWQQFEESKSLFIYESALEGFNELALLLQDVNEENLPDLKEVIHAQKGVSGMIGADELFEILFQMNKLLNAGNQIPKDLVKEYHQSLKKYQLFLEEKNVSN